MKPFFVYMLRGRDGSYYVGHTDELEKRMAEHHDGTFGGHTARRRPLELVWTAELSTRAEALEAELQLKRWTRAKKEALVRGDWAALKRLARGPDRHERASCRSGAPFDSAPGCAGRYAQGERMKDPLGCQRMNDPARERTKDAPGQRMNDPTRERTKGSPGQGMKDPADERVDDPRSEPMKDPRREPPAQGGGGDA